MSQFEIIEFYLELVRRAQERGICCAITSGMACVAYRVAEATKDCDLLCEPDHAADFLALLAESPVDGAPCQYRGNISPPLDARWHRGGWTSHFEWPGTEAFLDVFGIAPRARSAWQEEMLVTVRKASSGKQLSLQESHDLRVRCAGEFLPPRPISSGTLEGMVNESRLEALAGLDPELARWLPDVIPNFTLLVSGLRSES